MLAEAGCDTDKSVLGRALAVLDCFHGDASLTLAELTRRSGLPKSTVHRYLNALVRWGALERCYGEFRLGLKLFELGSFVQRYKLIREAAQPFLNELLQRTTQTVHLGVLDGAQVVYLDKLQPPGAPDVASRCGGRMPAHCTGLGKALLGGNDTALGSVLTTELDPLTPYTITQPAILQDDIVKGINRGFATDIEEASLGLHCLAAAARDPRGKPVAAVSVTLPRSLGDPKAFRRLVCLAADQLAIELRKDSYLL